MTRHDGQQQSTLVRSHWAVITAVEAKRKLGRTPLHARVLKQLRGADETYVACNYASKHKK